MSSRLQPRLPRVFCIGWHKTGTTTIGLALINLGYSVLGCRLDMVHPLRRGDIDSVLDLAGQFDAVQDIPWAALYRALDKRYPGSRFILTEREPERWLESAARHFGSHEIPLHAWLYGEGKLAGNEELYLNCYMRHNEDVQSYFSGRTEDLLVLNFEKGDRWERLCDFLGVPVPASVFPHENKSAEKRTLSEKIYDQIRQLTPRSIREMRFQMKLKLLELRGLPDPRDRFHNFKENRAEREAETRELPS